MNKGLVVTRVKDSHTSMYRYYAEVGIEAVIDKQTADQYEQAEAWMVESMLDRMIAQLLEWRKNGVKTTLVKARDSS